MDNDAGLESWDNLECDSHEEVIEALDGGFGIIDQDVWENTYSYQIMGWYAKWQKGWLKC